MSPAQLEGYLVVGAILFALGMLGFLTRRNMIIMFLSAEMMLQGVAIPIYPLGIRDPREQRASAHSAEELSDLDLLAVGDLQRSTGCVGNTA